jgi:hypothetical protein
MSASTCGVFIRDKMISMTSHGVLGGAEDLVALAQKSLQAVMPAEDVDYANRITLDAPPPLLTEFRANLEIPVGERNGAYREDARRLSFRLNQIREEIGHTRALTPSTGGAQCISSPEAAKLLSDAYYDQLRRARRLSFPQTLATIGGTILGTSVCAVAAATTLVGGFEWYLSTPFSSPGELLNWDLITAVAWGSTKVGAIASVPAPYLRRWYLAHEAPGQVATQYPWLARMHAHLKEPSTELTLEYQQFRIEDTSIEVLEYRQPGKTAQILVNRQPVSP